MSRPDFEKALDEYRAIWRSFSIHSGNINLQDSIYAEGMEKQAELLAQYDALQAELEDTKRFEMGCRNAEKRAKDECEKFREWAASNARERDALAEQVRVLREACEACMEQWRGPDEGHTAYFERQAERFYRATGLMAPGKSQPLELHHTDSDSERAKAWEAFVNKPYTLLQAALRAHAAGGEK